jgi:hypothetical protein
MMAEHAPDCAANCHWLEERPGELRGFELAELDVFWVRRTGCTFGLRPWPRLDRLLRFGPAIQRWYANLAI